MAELTVADVTLAYEEKNVIENISIELHENELVCLLGASGGGKTTLFHVIAGLLKPDRGQIFLNGSDITGDAGHISYMLQKDMLLPYRTIEDNIALSLLIKGEKKAAARKKVRAYLGQFGLADTERKYPHQLSGGMRQRAALIRTLALDPDLLLLDEPFSALDYQTRLTVCDDIASIIKKEHKTAILVTHDLSEAISVADRVLVLSSRPASVKTIVPIKIDIPVRTPMKSRNAPEFKEYFNRLWKELNKNA